MLPSPEHDVCRRLLQAKGLGTSCQYGAGFGRARDNQWQSAADSGLTAVLLLENETRAS